MSQKINLRVWLKIPDAEAATVKNTLIRRLGYGHILADVKKERLFSIEVDSGDPLELAEASPRNWSMKTRRAIRSISAIWSMRMTMSRSRLPCILRMARPSPSGSGCAIVWASPMCWM